MSHASTAPAAQTTLQLVRSEAHGPIPSDCISMPAETTTRRICRTHLPRALEPLHPRRTYIFPYEMLQSVRMQADSLSINDHVLITEAVAPRFRPTLRHQRLFLHRRFSALIRDCWRLLRSLETLYSRMKTSIKTTSEPSFALKRRSLIANKINLKRPFDTPVRLRVLSSKRAKVPLLSSLLLRSRSMMCQSQVSTPRAARDDGTVREHSDSAENREWLKTHPMKATTGPWHSQRAVQAGRFRAIVPSATSLTSLRQSEHGRHGGHFRGSFDCTRFRCMRTFD